MIFNQAVVPTEAASVCWMTGCRFSEAGSLQQHTDPVPTLA